MINHDTEILAAIGERAAVTAIASDTAGAIRIETPRDVLWDMLEKYATRGMISWGLAKEMFHNPNTTKNDALEIAELCE